MPVAKLAGMPGKRSTFIQNPLARAKWYRSVEVKLAKKRRHEIKYKITYKTLPSEIKEAIHLWKLNIQGDLPASAVSTTAVTGLATYFGTQPVSAVGTAALVLTASLLGIPAARLNAYRDVARELYHRLHRSKNPKLQKYLTNSKYFFVDLKGNIIFTDVKPRLSLTKRIPTKTNQFDKRSSVTRFAERTSDVYFRFAWPYLLSMVQMPVDRYRSLMKAADLKPGQTVLEIASGAVPYNRMFRTALGPNGHLIVSDYNPRVVADSKQINHLLDKVTRRSKLAQKSPVSHLTVDANATFPFQKNSIDRIVGARVYSFNLAEVLRVLKKGGKIVIVSPRTEIIGNMEKLEKEKRIKILDSGRVIEKLTN